jgi:hypothetical protein
VGRNGRKGVIIWDSKAQLAKCESEEKHGLVSRVQSGSQANSKTAHPQSLNIAREMQVQTPPHPLPAHHLACRVPLHILARAARTSMHESRGPNGRSLRRPRGIYRRRAELSLKRNEVGQMRGSLAVPFQTLERESHDGLGFSVQSSRSVTYDLPDHEIRLWFLGFGIEFGGGMTTLT